MLEAHSHILKAIASGRPLPEVLTLIVRAKEELVPHERCAICLIDTDRVTLLDGASPSLTPQMSRALHHLELTDESGSLGSVDPRQHPAWAPYRAEIEAHGLRLARAEPIVTATGEVAGYAFGLAASGSKPSPDEQSGWVSLLAELTLVALRHAQVDQDLQLSEGRMTALIENTPAVIVLKDLEGRYLLANPAMQQLFDLRQAEILGRDASLFGNEVAHEVARLQRQTLASGRPQRAEIEVSGRWLSAIYFPVTTPRGTPYAVGVIALDVTDEKRNRERLIQAAKMETAARLASGVAHDFNNILTGIALSADAAEYAGAEAAELRSALKDIKSFVSLAASISQRLLQIGRPGAAEPEIVDVNGVVASLAPLLEATVRGKARVVMDTGSGVPHIRVDRTDLERALVNLVANAGDAVGPQGRVTVATRLVETDVPEVDISVEDDGEGIDPAVVDRVLEPFFTTKAQGGGFGLGLAVVQATVVGAGGRVDIESEVGLGTTVHLFLPVAR